MNIHRHIHETFRAWRAMPFAWGAADCLCFAAECARPIVGRDPIAQLRGRYDSEVSARQLMMLNGWRHMGDVALSLFPEVSVAHAQAGDWALLINAGGLAEALGVTGTEVIGVVVGDRIAAKTAQGTDHTPLGRATRAFRVSP